MTRFDSRKPHPPGPGGATHGAPGKDKRAPSRPPQGGRGEPGAFGKQPHGSEAAKPQRGGEGKERLHLPHTRPAGPRPETRPAPHAADSRAPHRPAATAETPRGSLWLYGQHAVAAALRNPARRLRRLVLTEEAEAALLSAIPLPWPLAPERVERGRLDHLLGRDVVHQGVGLLADPLAPPGLAQALERPGPVLVLDQVTDPRNVGAILRSAAAFGVAAVIVQDRHAPEETGALAKAASGALEVVPLLRAVNLARTLVALKAAGLWTVGLAADAPALNGGSLAQRRIALVLGAEGEGLRRLTRETCDETAGLAIQGVMESLNVSAAAAVALYELRRAL